MKQLEQKDMQIEQLHKIIYNKDTKLLEYDSKKRLVAILEMKNIFKKVGIMFQLFLTKKIII
ncbi:hypothetical protein [Streptococcus pyogenes]|uniref:hypothetical protein n=1 Tax=Streptococcus pyogenes TaxID=1314 RepID=UPI0010D5D253|nr:hypothetical protein [Streptococcus pyogenes]VHD16769.1 Uncharacterised protein [Streptococcus pyogenes]